MNMCSRTALNICTKPIRNLSHTAPVNQLCRSYSSSKSSFTCACCGIPYVSCSRNKLTRQYADTKDAWTKSRSWSSFKNGNDDDDHIDKLLENNKKWVEETKEKQPDFFERLGKYKQSPRYLYFGCSDARVPANQILGLGAGEVFVHRNIGNQVPANDLNALSVLEYAVTHIGITDIIVTGHYDCGAVRAATSR